MNLEERMTYLQQCMEEAMKTGASRDDIAMYESTISEMVRISDWIGHQCKGRNRIYFERGANGTRQYVKFRNETGIDFRFVAMKVAVKREEKTVDTFEIAAANWRAGRTARLYFETEIRDGDTLSFDANSIEYQVMNGKVHDAISM